MILVAGAGGCVGSALVAELQRHPAPEGAPRAVRAFVRREFDAVRLRDQGVEAVTGDLVTGRGLDEAMRGVQTLVYLVDTLNGRSSGDLVATDLEAVQHTLIAARAANVRRVIALSHVAASEEATSRYLVARWAVELAVRQSGLEWTLLRAPIILGAGSTLWELLHRVVDRSPVVPLYRWRRTEVEPVALEDVVEALRIAIDEPERGHQSYDVTGASRIDFRRVLRGWARVNGRHRLYVPLPGWGERELAWFGSTVARLPRQETRALLETLRERQVCTDPSRRFPLGRRPLGYEDALQRLR